LFLHEKFEFCSSVEAGNVLNLFLNFEQKLASCSNKIVLINKQKQRVTVCVHEILELFWLFFGY